MKTKLDPKTLRTLSRRLRQRSRELDKENKRLKLIGQQPSMVRVGRANEVDLWADDLLTEARTIERQQTSKLTPATTLCGPHERKAKKQ